MQRELKRSVCRICHAGCSLVVELEDGVVQSIRGDKHDPAYYGYSCIKGRESASVLTLPSRLLTSIKRQADGNHAPIEARRATAEIAARLKSIIAQYGPNSVALYIGTYGYINFAAHGFALAFMRAIGSQMVFTSVTIDQPGKAVGLAMHGPWLAGTPPMAEWDALLLVGTNPIVSMNGGLGVNPARQLKQAQYRGMKLVVIDPRRTECARHADVFLQCRPGEDGVILAGIARELIANAALDSAFIAAETQGLAELRAAVEPFTPDCVAARAGIAAADLIAAASILGAARKGAISAGTGANMSGQGNLVEYLVKVLTTLRGWWSRAGDIKPNAGVLIDPLPALAASPGPFPANNFGTRMRVRELTESAAGLPTAALADEILLPGDGQIKALLVLGGNPMSAWPDQSKTLAAMQALELLVCFDPHLSDTAKLADYVLAPKLPLEIESNTAANELFGSFGPGWGYEQPYAQASAPILDIPAGADVHEEWEFIYDLAQHMEVELAVKPFSILDPARAEAAKTPVDMSCKPTPSDVWRMILQGAPVPYDEVVRQSALGNQAFARPPLVVQPKPSGWTGCLHIGAAPMMTELHRLATASAVGSAGEQEFPLRLISRRMNDVVNSTWHENPKQLRKWSYNPAFMHPNDLAAIGAATGDMVEITSSRGSIIGIAAASEEVKAGCVSISHCWGRKPDETEDPRQDGCNTNRLVCADSDFDPYTGIPLMSAIPVRVSKKTPATESL